MFYRAAQDPRIRPITDAFFTVYNYFGPGLVESAYCGGLEYELIKSGHRVAREAALEIRYKGIHVAWQRADFLVDESVIVEVKATELLAPTAKPQLMNYLAATSIEVGVLLHFGLEPRYHRLTHTNKRPCID